MAINAQSISRRLRRARNSIAKIPSKIKLLSVARQVSEGQSANNSVSTDSPLSGRKTFIRQANRASSVLEIGPFHNPSLQGSNVSYFDLQDDDELAERVREYGLSDSKVPHIDYFSATGDLTIIDRKFSAVFSSHCIEHQPDLIFHLNCVANLLEDGGKYYAIVPDKRYCFDHFLAKSTLGSILEAHRQQRRLHSLESVIAARTMLTHNEKARHWTGDHGQRPTGDDLIGKIQDAIAEYDNSKGQYIDVHAWAFTPSSFSEILMQICRLGFSRLGPELVCDTPRGQHEFNTVLTKDAA